MKFNILLLILTTLAAVALTSPLLSSANSVSKELIAKDFADNLRDKLDQDKIDAAVNSMLKTSTSYHVQEGSVECAVFYLRLNIPIAGEKTFDGNAGGLCSPGAETFSGDVYTDDLDRLYRDTVSIEFNLLTAYVNVNFFDSNSNLLGSLHAGAISLNLGIGGGVGVWS